MVGLELGHGRLQVTDEVQQGGGVSLENSGPLHPFVVLKVQL